MSAPTDQAAGHPGFVLHTVAGLHRPGLHNYYGFVCHLTPHREALSRLLCLPYPNGKVQGFPSYNVLPVSCPTLNHVTGLARYRASRYFARLPACAAESGSLKLCAAHFLSLPSDPAVTSNALAIRIVFPPVGATPASFSRPGLPATLGKQKRGGHFDRPFCHFAWFYWFGLKYTSTPSPQNKGFAKFTVGSSSF